MKSKHFFITLCFMFFLTSCVTSNMGSSYQRLVYKQLDKSDREYIFPNMENCSSLYTNGELSILEVYCSQGSDGLYIFGKNDQTRFDWYDEKFNLWATSEGCNSKDACFYELKVDKNGVILAFAYHFFINLSEGVYRVRVTGETLKIVEQQIIDQPS